MGRRFGRHRCGALSSILVDKAKMHKNTRIVASRLAIIIIIIIFIIIIIIIRY